MTVSTKLIAIDPNGDTLIILRNPKYDLPRWKEEPKARDSELPQNTGTDEANAAAQYQASAEDDGASGANSPAVRFLASSRQLRLVSTYFDNMFKRPYTETVPSAEDGLYHIDAQEWNPDAMEIVLNLAHVQTGRVPRQATLAMLVQIFVIIDYYQMNHSIAVYVRQWLSILKSMEKPTSYCTETILWMLLSLIMRDWHVFGAMTHIATTKASQPIQYLGLPFPIALQELLDWRRCHTIGMVLSGAQRLPEDLEQGKDGCNEACTAMLLVSIRGGLRKASLLSVVQDFDIDDYELTGLCFKETCIALRSIELPEWYSDPRSTVPHVDSATSN